MKQLLAINGREFELRPGVDIPTPLPVTTSLEKVVADIIGIILAIIGVLVIIYLIYGGILYITAGGDAEKAGKGRTAITNAIIGLVVIIAAYVIYGFVLSRLGVTPPY